MKKHHPSPAAMFLLFIGIFALGLTHASASVPKSGQELILLYSNDVNGETEPCG